MAIQRVEKNGAIFRSPVAKADRRGQCTCEKPRCVMCRRLIGKKIRK